MGGDRAASPRLPTWPDVRSVYSTEYRSLRPTTVAAALPPAPHLGLGVCRPLPRSKLAPPEVPFPAFSSSFFRAAHQRERRAAIAAVPPTTSVVVVAAAGSRPVMIRR